MLGDSSAAERLVASQELCSMELISLVKIRQAELILIQLRE
jgi:hypothetical protein